jgi:hypothetical protein
MARLCRVRALNALTRVQEQVHAWGSLEQGGGEPSSEAKPTRGGVSSRVRRNPLEGGVSPRARRNPLEGAFDWATSVGRGGLRSVGRALCVCLSKRCVLFLFFAGFKKDSPGFLGDPQGCPRQQQTGPCQLSSPLVKFFERSHRSVDLRKYRQPCIMSSIMRWI